MIAWTDPPLPGVQDLLRAGLAHHRAGRIGAACDLYRAALDLAPGDAVALGLLGTAEAAQGHAAAAVPLLLQAARLDPANASTAYNLGLQMRCLHRLAEARMWLQRAAALRPQEPLFVLNLAVAHGDEQRFDEALAMFDEALRLQPGWPRAAMGKAMCLLRMGDFRRGWPLHESRRVQPVVPWAQRDFGAPAWDGIERVEAQTVLVWAEQGFGDAIQFARFVTSLATLGARVVLEVHPQLVGLLQCLPGAQVLPFGAFEGRCDFHCPLMSLPYLLGRRYSGDIPGDAPYLHADAHAVGAWMRRIGKGPNVGLAWSGNPGHVMDFRRSLPLGRLLEALPDGIAWWCVQKDMPAADAQLLGCQTRVRRPPIGDFADTAALVASLDAVVTVDTSVAHLAGAMGRPTLLLVSEPADWRWQCARPDSPWYASVRLFRQHMPGDWSFAVASAMDHLQGVLADGSASEASVSAA